MGEKIPTCINCQTPLCREAGDMPVMVNDSTDVADVTKLEFWCPQDFVYIRASKEPERWDPRVIRAGKCGACGCNSLDTGLGRCVACNGKMGPVALGPRRIEDLGPEPKAKRAKAS